MPVFLFTDIEGSTRLWEDHASDMGAVIGRHDAILRAQIEGHGGHITKHTGDGVTAAFAEGEPLTCALTIQHQFGSEPWGAIGELHVRMGLHAGDAELHGGDYFGPAVNCTARIMNSAWGGQILLTPSVTAMSPLPADASLLDLGDHLLKDVREPHRILQMDHPDLPRHEFPPLRTLSSSAIRRAVVRKGQDLAKLGAPALAVDFVSAALAPTLLGDLSPSSPELVGNLNVLGDLGASFLREWLAAFAARQHAKKQAGETISELQISQRLEMELLERWLAGGPDAAALRTDASLLLRSLHGVDAALDAAPEGVRDSLARALSAVGSAFHEFRWMLDGLRETLAKVEARQDVQLALQREQIDLQREQLAKTNRLIQWQEGELLPDGTTVYSLPVTSASVPTIGQLLGRLGEYHAGVLDLPSLAALYAGRGQWAIGPRESPMLVRSALHHGVDVGPWLRRMGSPEAAAQLLRENYDQCPTREVRGRIVSGLDNLQGDAPGDALVHVALTDDAPGVRSQAALAAARRGRANQTMTGLIAALNGPHHDAALAAFVALADEAGIPPDIGPYPRLPVLAALAWKRWRANREAVMRQTGRSALTGLLVSVFGCATPLFYHMAYPEEFQHLVAEVLPLGAWIFSGALMFMLLGTIQGTASGFALGLADALWHDIGHRTWRWTFGVGSGLALATLLTLLSFWEVTSPEVSAALYIPVYVFCGLANGAAATLVIPPLGARPPVRSLLEKAVGAILVLAASAVPYAFLLSPSTAVASLLQRLLYAIGFPLALALLLGRWQGAPTHAVESASEGHAGH